MTAETFTATVRPASTYSLEKYHRGSAPIGATALASLKALSATSTVADALDILSSATKDDYVVDANQMGRATSVLAGEEEEDGDD